ncbi:MAG TPA: hypothetical protein VF188_12880 [Longimicrobiales bacterium]
MIQRGMHVSIVAVSILWGRRGRQHQGATVGERDGNGRERERERERLRLR